jgi:hypothetical protein
MNQEKNREALFYSLQDINQDLLIIIYGSKEKFFSTINLHPAEKIIIQYDEKFMGNENVLPILSSLTGIAITNKSSRLMTEVGWHETFRSYLEIEARTQPMDPYGNKSSVLTLSQVLDMGTYEWEEYLKKYFPYERNVGYNMRSDFVISRFYSSQPFI